MVYIYGLDGHSRKKKQESKCFYLNYGCLKLIEAVYADDSIGKA